VLIMDADQTVVVSDPHCIADLTIDGYNIDIHHANLVYPHPWLLKSTLPWRWERTTHEYLACDEPYKAGSLVGLHLVEHADSYRRKTGAKMTEDYALLQAAYDDDPTEPRTVFYLAQACADLGKLSCALRHYRERVKLGGWIEEVWCAQYRAAKILEVQNNWEAAIEAHLTAFSMCSNRAEPLYRLGKGFLAHKQFAPAGLFFAEAADIPLPTGKLFVETGVYEYQALWGLSMVHRLLSNHAQANELENVILKGEHTPALVIADIITSRSTKSIGSLPG
jgi:tetratricopeptide (TPR) repeat protein